MISYVYIYYIIHNYVYRQVSIKGTMLVALGVSSKGYNKRIQKAV